MPAPTATGAFARVPAFTFALLALVLLALTLLWHIPMMLWDHLDLVPIYRAWSDGALAASPFWSIHGGHLHTAAYAVLIATTFASGGEPWLDCALSWLLLIAYALVVSRFVRESFPNAARADRGFALLAISLALYPGHLANLQWGWQVAVFLCLLGGSVTIAALTRAKLSLAALAIALAGFALAFLSFATAIALVPTALLLIALRREQPIAKRALFALPWLAVGAALAFVYPRTNANLMPLPVLLYALNFLGAGIARYATGAAPWLALAGLGSALWLGARVRHRRDALPWIGLAVFAVTAALLAALARTEAWGSDQAFVTRYVSFSSLFWLGWCGLVGCAWPTLTRARTAWRGALALVALLATFNALHLIKKAHDVGVHTREIAATIRRTWPSVDRALLGEIYFDQPDVAQARLQQLHALGFAPFDAPP